MQAAQGFYEAPISTRGEDRSCVAGSSSPVYFATVFAWTMSAVSAVMCAVVRLPLGEPHWFVFVKALLLTAGITSCAAVLTVRCVEQRRTSYAPVLLTTLAVIFLPCLVWLVGSVVDIVAYPVLLGLAAIGLRQIVAMRGITGMRARLMLGAKE